MTGILKKFSPHPFLRRLLASAIVSSLAMAAIISGFLYTTNEIDVFSDGVIKRADNLLWGPGFGQQHMAYKLQRALYVKPDLLMLGSSRVTQFRDVMAPDGARFYNASLAATSLGSARAFLSSLYEYHVPKTILLGIDPWWFRPGRSGQYADKGNIQQVVDFNYQAFISTALSSGASMRVLNSLMGENLRQKTDPLGGRRPVGYHAALTGNGFRADGSYQYGDILTGRNRSMKTRHMGAAENFAFYREQASLSLGRFSYTGDIDSAEQALLREIIQQAQSRGINLVLFFPPIAAKVMEAVRNTPNQAAYFNKVRKVVSAIATEFRVEFHNFHDLGELGIADSHTIDGVHVDEIASLAMLRRMIDESPVLASLYDQKGIERLEKILEDRENWAGPKRILP